MKPTPDTIKKRLMSIIKDMSADPRLFVKNPERDFTRNRKLNFESMMRFLLGKSGGSLQSELMEFSHYASDTVTTSAFIQQREKLLPFALEYILHKFTSSFPGDKRYKGNRLLAVDGSDFIIPTNPKETANHFVSNPDGKGYNMLHLNALYDLCNNTYIDALIQNRRGANERKALISLVGRSYISNPVILIADRGYESYNALAHIEKKGWKYLFRIQDHSGRGILSGLTPPNTSEYDIQIQKILTRKQTKQTRAKPEIYRIMPKNSAFDFLGSNMFYPISFRIVRFRISEESYEVIITNLDQKDFPPQELKKLYHMRWGIESAFRTLKYSVGALNFHSKKAEYISQELFAAIIMYNFSQMIISLIIIPQKKTRYSYQLNVSLAIRVCRYFFRSRDPAHPPDVEALILANTVPVRNGRCFARKVRFRQAIGFNYRIS